MNSSNSNRKNILIVTAYPVNNLTAGQGNINIITDDLIAKGYNVSLVCFSYPEHAIERKERFKEILYINQGRPQRYLYMLLLAFFFPLYTARFSLRALQFIRAREKTSSLIYLDYAQVYIYAMFIQDRSKICMFAHDVILQKYQREFQNKWYEKFILKFVKFTEKKMFGYCDKIAIASFKDLEILNKEYKVNATPAIVKNRFKTVASLNVPVSLSHFVFLGAWNRNENLDGLKWFFHKVFPLLSHKVSFTILGQGLPDEFKAQLPSRVKAKGFVEDLNFFLQEASALVSPLFLGAGIKFKILDAIKNGCRVIGTDISYEGIEVSAENLLLVANNAEEFANGIHYCMEAKYDPDDVKQLLDEYINKFTDTLEWTEQNIVD